MAILFFYLNNFNIYLFNLIYLFVQNINLHTIWSQHLLDMIATNGQNLQIHTYIHNWSLQPSSRGLLT